MTNARTRLAHLLLALCLALPLVAGTAGGVRADADPSDVQTLNRVFAAMASLKFAPPLQIALWEADAIVCLDKPSKPSARLCALSAVPQNVFFQILVDVVLKGAAAITGTWATIDINLGTNNRHMGSIEIDSNNLGTLISNEAGFATLQFYSVTGPAATALSKGSTVVGFDYIHYINNMRNDAGYGVLIETFDGCKMYGRFYSVSDSTTLGTLFLARC